jgi:hypothetical protein
MIYWQSHHLCTVCITLYGGPLGPVVAIFLKDMLVPNDLRNINAEIAGNQEDIMQIPT